MAGVFAGGTASSSNPHDGTTYIGKTGTTDNAIHVWMVGSSTAVATAVWVGNIKGKQSLRQISVNGTQAALLRHKIFKPAALRIDSYYPGHGFPPPDPALLKGNPVIVPDLRGMTLEAARAAIDLAELNFVDGGSGDSDLPAGQVAVTSPGAGESVPRGTDIIVFLSNGLAKAIPDVNGQPFPSARDFLNDEGFTNVVGQCDPADLGDPLGTVYSMDPPAGTVVNKAAIITLHYYGPPCLP
jgi:membrane peptidoglycan carboxypeptidase